LHPNNRRVPFQGAKRTEKFKNLEARENRPRKLGPPKSQECAERGLSKLKEII